MRQDYTRPEPDTEQAESRCAPAELAAEAPPGPETRSEGTPRPATADQAPEPDGATGHHRSSDADRVAFLERRTAELERTCKLALRERDLATALAGRPLVPGAAAQLIKLWRDELDVYEEDGQMRVATRDGRPVAGAVEEWLAGPDYAHFRRPTSRGGTATGGTERSVSGTPPAPRPSNLGEAVLHRWRESAAHRGESGTPPVGLVRPRFR